MGRLTTALSQDGVAGLAAPGAAAAAQRATAGTKAPAAAAGGARAGGKRGLEPLGQAAGATRKRQKTGAGAGAKPAPAAGLLGAGAAGGGRGGRNAATAAGALDDSQALSIGGLLQSAQRRAAEATQPSQAQDDR